MAFQPFDGTFSEPRAVRIPVDLDDAARALRAAGEKTTPHGGIPPHSLLADEMGRITLTDFGIAPAFEAGAGAERRRTDAVVERCASPLQSRFP